MFQNNYFSVYFEASDSCNSLDFAFGSAAVGVTAVATRTFSVKVCQCQRFYIYGWFLLWLGYTIWLQLYKSGSAGMWSMVFWFRSNRLYYQFWSWRYHSAPGKPRANDLYKVPEQSQNHSNHQCWSISDERLEIVEFATLPTLLPTLMYLWMSGKTVG